MQTFNWDEKYSVNVDTLDEQHKHLFDIVKRLYIALEDKDDRIALALVINDLVKYSKEHFIEEERYLIRNQYPNYEAHKKQHDVFMTKIEQFAADYNSGRYLLHFDILLFLKNWVLQHILVADKHFGDYIKSAV